MTPENIQATVDEMFGLLLQYGDADYIGEDISQIEHAAQAAQSAEREGYDEETILAALFHDIGHLCVQEDGYRDMGGFGNQEHEKVGKAFLLRMGFSQKVIALVTNHVAAKRYLTFKYPDYYNKLSDASKKTLEFQGGRMSAEEAAAFEADPYFEGSIKLRQWDEEAKLVGIPLPNWEPYKAMCQRHLQAQNQ